VVRLVWPSSLLTCLRVWFPPRQAARGSSPPRDMACPLLTTSKRRADLHEFAREGGTEKLAPAGDTPSGLKDRFEWLCCSVASTCAGCRRFDSAQGRPERRRGTGVSPGGSHASGAGTEASTAPSKAEAWRTADGGACRAPACGCSSCRKAETVQRLAGFKNGEYRVLVATDIAARGIDVEDLGHVISRRLPAGAGGRPLGSAARHAVDVDIPRLARCRLTARCCGGPGNGPPRVDRVSRSAPRLVTSRSGESTFYLHTWNVPKTV
jgi:hypothetical protein